MDIGRPLGALADEEAQLIVVGPSPVIDTEDLVETGDVKSLHAIIGLGALVEILPQFGSDNLVGIDHQHPFARRTLDGKGAGWFCTHAVALGIGHDLAAIALGNLYGTVGRFHVADHDLVEVLDCFETLGQVALGVISVDDY